MAETERRFVIQQHDATRLHWDLRLERDGVLASWALPRGVPWDPGENRLAVQTEDHGLEFLDYEGEAADPGYGKGRMTNWDRGTFELHKWEDRKVVVTLTGSKVSGKYALFSMRGSRDWLIHRMDPPADSERKAVPYGVPPMRAVAGDLPDDPTGWTFETSFRGLRASLTDDTGRVTIHGADGEDLSLRFPEVRRIGRALGHREVVLDGCIVPVGAGGSIRHDRHGLARRMRIRSDSGARNAAKTAPVVFVAFDILWMDGHALTALPLELRRRQLDDLKLDGPGWRASPVLSFEEAAMSETGIIAKRLDSAYLVGQTSRDWLRTDPSTACRAPL